MRRTFAVLFVLALLAVMVAAIPVGATDELDDAFGDPAKVWVCHFDGHEAGSVFYVSQSGLGEDLDGDYVVPWQNEDPFPTNRQAEFCEDPLASGELLPVAGNLILISVNAVDNPMVGHRVQNLERGIGSYPDGYKG